MWFPNYSIFMHTKIIKSHLKCTKAMQTVFVHNINGVSQAFRFDFIGKNTEHKFSVKRWFSLGAIFNWISAMPFGRIRCVRFSLWFVHNLNGDLDVCLAWVPHTTLHLNGWNMQCGDRDGNKNKHQNEKETSILKWTVARIVSSVVCFAKQYARYISFYCTYLFSLAHIQTHLTYPTYPSSLKANIMPG